MRPWTFLLDLDGTYKGEHSWALPEQPWQFQDLTATAEFLTLLHASGSQALALTRRPPAQAALLELNGRFALTEEGGTIWSHTANTTRLNPKFRSYAETVVPEVDARLHRALPLSVEGPVVLQAGGRLVSRCIYPRPDEASPFTVEGLAQLVRELLADLPVQVVVGHAVDVLPAEPWLSKAVACEWLTGGLYEEHYGRALDWERVVFIDDSMSADPAARYVHEHGGQVATLANAHPSYRALIAKLGGLIAAEPGTRGCLEIARRVVV
jgi:hypothetical protein